jgi:NAD(P)-dependent dehydrogenase (short-subunit alcohol dehydrogenase family)
MSGRGYIVTGGTGALGRAVVLRLLRDGNRVAVPFHTATPWSDLRAAADLSESLWGQPADMSDPAAAERFAEAALQWLGGLDGVAALVGGYAGSGHLEAAPETEWDEMLRLNLGSAYATCRAVLPRFGAGGGSLVLVSSQLARSGGAGASAYAVAKAGVETLARVLALENRGRRIRVNAVAPRIIDTPDNRKALPREDHESFTAPDDIAAVITCLLAPESLPVSGAVIPLAGRG